MSEQAETAAPAVPAAEILPAKSEDKLEIEKEEKAEAAEAEKAKDEDGEEKKDKTDEDQAAAGAKEDDKDKKKFKLPNVHLKAPKVPGFLRGKSKERKKVGRYTHMGKSVLSSSIANNCM
jgi:hypothetical protein